MSEEQDYYDELLSQGYTEQRALDYTNKYFPDFTNELPEPAPPPSFADKGSAHLPEMKLGKTKQYDFESVVEDTKIIFEMARDKVIENRRAGLIAGGIFAIILVSILAFKIPSTTGPIEGDWLKSDGQKLTFDSTGTYSDSSDFSSTWEFSGDNLTIVSTDIYSNSNGTAETYLVLQEARIEISDDGNAMWLKWVKWVIDGEELSPPDQCILLLKSSVAKNAIEYGEVADRYLLENPQWCIP